MIAVKIAHTEYLSLGPSRRYSFEHPYDAFGGPASGRKEGPAIALIGAAGTFMTGLEIGGLIGGLMMAGSIASAVGAVTGNEFLSTVGMGLSLAGGIGGAFTDVAGNFYNPFGEGGFAGSALGQGAKGVSDKLSSWFGNLTGGNAAPGISGDAIVANASSTGTEGLSQLAADPSGSLTSDVFDLSKSVAGSGGPGVDLAASAASSASSAAAKPGMLASLGSKLGLSGDGMGQVLSSAIEGVANYNPAADKAELDLMGAKEENLQANTNATNVQAGLLQQKYNNMQQQPAVNTAINPNADPYSTRNQQIAGDVVSVVMNGKVVSMPRAEYEQMIQQQQGGAANG